MKKFLGFSLALCLVLTGCGSSETSESAVSSYNDGDYGYTAGINAKSQSYDSYDSADGETYYDEEYAAEDYDDVSDSAVLADNTSSTADSALSDAENSQTSADKKGVIDTEMLVYTCNVSIRTEKFEDSYNMLKNLIEDMEGFTESEDYNENDSSYGSSKTARLTVRVPSKNYNNMLDSFGDIGTVTSKSSNAENVSQEYSDTEKALEIYEAEEARYIERIKTIKDESALLELESKITELQIKIAQLKSRKSQIETDVAYSYVYITLSESVYKEETQTSFGGRLMNMLNRSWHGFLDICEGLLFFIILVLPEIIVICIIVLIIIKLVKRRKRKKQEKIAKKEAPHDNASEPKVDTSDNNPSPESNNTSDES